MTEEEEEEEGETETDLFPQLRASSLFSSLACI